MWTDTFHETKESLFNEMDDWGKTRTQLHYRLKSKKRNEFLRACSIPCCTFKSISYLVCLTVYHQHCWTQLDLQRLHAHAPVIPKNITHHTCHYAPEAACIIQSALMISYISSKHAVAATINWLCSIFSVYRFLIITVLSRSQNYWQGQYRLIQSEWTAYS